jgi:hypothetical protein
MREMESTQVSYGLGWRLLDYRGAYLIEHGGAVDGFRAHLTLVPKARMAVVVLCNLGSTEFPAALSRSLLDRMMELKPKDWNAIYSAESKRAASSTRLKPKRHPGTKPSRDLESYTGTYDHPGYGQATVTRKNGSLSLQWSSFDLRLEHFHYETFLTQTNDARERSRIGGEPVVFMLNPDGNVARLRFLGQEFRKKP